MKKNKIKIKINNKQIICDSGMTIMQAANKNGIELPSLCFHPDLSVKANCKVCVVEISGRKGLFASCSTKVEDEMEIMADTDKVRQARNLNIELIFAEHIERCPTCVWRVNCKLLELADKYKVEMTRFADRKGKRKIYKFANSVEIDGTKCVDCRNCVDACANLQKINYLELKGKGINQEVVAADGKNILPFMNKKADKIDCIYCGQCALHCPVGAAKEQTHWRFVEKVLRDKSKVVVAQFAPSIRVSVGEEFGAEYGKVMLGQVVSSLKKLGFDYVFDVNCFADITTIVEAEEFIERLKSGGKMPMLTSCCPAWVKFVEFYRPELIPNLTSSRSPQIHGAGLIKTYWAEKLKISPKKIVVVSIMPCTAKKFESARPELKIRGIQPVDYVITTRELAWMIKKNKIDFLKLKPEQADNPFGESSGAAAIYGASGGMMESALRTAEYFLSQGEKSHIGNSRLEFKDMRGQTGIKLSEIEIAGKKLKIAVVNGIGNIGTVLEKIKDYDYIEVMACPGGCVGGGGQPIPTTNEIIKKRIAALYKIDAKSKIRKAHENKQAQEALEWLEKQGKLKEQILHTKYKKRN